MTASACGNTAAEASASFQVRMATKFTDCPVCDGKSTMICRRTGIEDRKALETSEWFERRLREGSSIYYDGEIIPPESYLVRNHRICQRCLFIHSIEDDVELEHLLNESAIDALREGQAWRMKTVRSILGKPADSGQLAGGIDFGKRLMKRSASGEFLSMEGRRLVHDSSIRNVLGKLCLQHVSTTDSNDAIQAIAGKLFVNGTGTINALLFDLPVVKETIACILQIEAACIMRIVAENNEFSFTQKSPKLTMEDAAEFARSLREKRGGLLIRHHLLFSTSNTLRALSEVVNEQERNQVLEMALLFAELSMQHEDRRYLTEADKEREKKKEEERVKAQERRMAHKEDADAAKTPVKVVAPTYEVEIDPKRVPHNLEILTCIILHLQRILGKPVDEDMRDRAIRQVEVNDTYAFTGTCGSIAKRLRSELESYR